MLRATGVTPGVLVAALDIGKGVASVILAAHLTGAPVAPAAAGLAAIVGHVYPVWLGFRGGKGVATACGVFAVLAPVAALAALGIFVASVWLTKYVSVGSVLASMTLPLIAYSTGRSTPIVAVQRRRGRADRVQTPVESLAGLCRNGAPAGTRPAGGSVRARACRRDARFAGQEQVMRTIAVLGAGSWGTAIAVHLGRIGHEVRLWARDPRLVAEISARRANAVYLPDITLPESVSVLDALEPTLDRYRSRRLCRSRRTAVAR